jgi:tRNA pseudouridine55 synthase
VDDCLSLEVYCSKGTYIRSLAEDLGNYFGCGGTVKALRRIQSGQFSIADARTIEQLSEMTMEDLSACLLAVDKPLEHLPGVELSEQQASSLRLGQACDFPFPVNSNDNVITVRMYHAQDFLGLGEMLLNGKLAPKKIFNLNNA